MKVKYIKTLIVTICIVLGVTHSFAQKNTAFKQGEELRFKVSYGFLDAAEAKMVVDSDIRKMNGNSTYKIDVHGETLGVFKLFKVNDNWGTFMDTTKIIPYLSYRHIEEGKYRKHERVFFDHQAKNAEVRLYDREDKNLIDTKDYKIPPNVQDIVSGFYLLRTMNLRKLKKGETVTLNGFFDKEIYNLKLIYEGKETLDTELGKFDTFVFSPVMPKNKLFRGQQPVTVWVSDDQNKIPLRIKAKLVVGNLNMEIMDVKGLRNN